jgi:hypothetical protein
MVICFVCEQHPNAYSILGIVLQLHACSNATWASDPVEHRSVTGYCIILGSSPLHVNPRSRQQYLDQVSRQNFELLLLPLQRLYGYNGS